MSALTMTIFDQDQRRCFICGKYTATDTHHVFQGSNRAASDRYGLTVRLCRKCHAYIHENPQSETAVKLKDHAQREAMERYGWSLDEWRERFGKDYRISRC